MSEGEIRERQRWYMKRLLQECGADDFDTLRRRREWTAMWRAIGDHVEATAHGIDLPRDVEWNYYHETTIPDLHVTVEFR